MPLRVQPLRLPQLAHPKDMTRRAVAFRDTQAVSRAGTPRGISRQASSLGLAEERVNEFLKYRAFSGQFIVPIKPCLSKPVGEC
jgi:hypothetical protein